MGGSLTVGDGATEATSKRTFQEVAAAVDAEVVARRLLRHFRRKKSLNALQKQYLSEHLTPNSYVCAS